MLSPTVQRHRWVALSALLSNLCCCCTQESFEEKCSQLRKDVAAWAAKVHGHKRLLGNALSSKGIDICWREAEALNTKLDKELAGRIAAMKEHVDSSCEKITEDNRKFETEHLKTFEGEM